MKALIEQQVHGYRNGHQLLSTTLNLPRQDQDTVDRLSDMAGPLRPGEVFSSYLAAYPLPSRSHFVFARTWQDLEASRAGCVLTRSLLVPMSIWENLNTLDELIALLTPVELEGKRKLTEPVKPGSDPLPVVFDQRTVELVEAMFLENRQPIVFFESQEAEAITKRVLLALWPSLRRNFAVCSFTLAPRKIDGRDFDLVFAPKTARTRFADWPGRRIEATSSKEARHRWSISIASRIFQSNSPSLIADDTLGALKTDSRGDEATLRLSLLWSELLAKSATTPTAVLGMIDILNSRGEHSQDAFKPLAPIITRATNIASSSLPDVEIWHFLTTLVGKFNKGLPSKSIFRTIKSEASNLAGRNPRSALEFLQAESLASRAVPAVLLAGIGDGISSNSTVFNASEGVTKVPSKTGLGLIALSTKFARYAIALAKEQPDICIPRLLTFFDDPDRKLQRKARRRLTPLFNDDVLLPLLSPLLEGVTPEELSEFALRLGRETDFEISCFDEPIINASRDHLGLESLRNAIASNFNSPSSDRFIFKTLKSDIPSIVWLTGGSLGPERARRLLFRLLEETSDRNIQAILSEKLNCNHILDLLLSDRFLTASQIVRVLIWGDLKVDKLLELGLDLLPCLNHEDKGHLLRYLLERSLIESSPSDPRVQIILSLIASQIAPRQLIRAAFPSFASTSRVSENILLLNALPHQNRQGLLAHIDDLSNQLLNRQSDDLGAQAYAAWAQMIADSGQISWDTQLRAALPTLAFALEQTNFPVSTLIVETFPVVYAQLLRSKDENDFKLIPALLKLPFTFFADWDRAKAARRDLVEAFLRSSWPPADLLLAGLKAGIGDKILRRVSRSYVGNQYISAIEQDSYRFPPSIQTRLKATILNFQTSLKSNDWD
jgi:hypothetical protein